jgi:hypothetical protein
MKDFFVLILVGTTSLGAFLIGVGVIGMSWGSLGRAIGRMLEGVGLALIFFMANVAVGMTVVFAGRLLTRSFVSLYLADDMTLLVFSLLQGLTFQWWSERLASTRDRGLEIGG